MAEGGPPRLGNYISPAAGSKSAFDVWIAVNGPQGQGFLGIDVTYHEPMRVSAARDLG